MKRVLFDIKKRIESKENKVLKMQIKQIVLDNINTLFKIKLIASNYIIDNDRSNMIEILGLDENFQLVIIEFRNNINGRLINGGLFQIDYIKKHISEFKILLKDKGILDEVNYNARLIILSPNFSSMDKYSVTVLPYDIELFSYDVFDNSLSVNKEGVSKNILINDIHNDIIDEFNKVIIAMDDTLSIRNISNILLYRSIVTIMYLNTQNMELIFNNKVYKLDYDTFDKIISDIEAYYD